MSTWDYDEHDFEDIGLCPDCQDEVEYTEEDCPYCGCKLYNEEGVYWRRWEKKEGAKMVDQGDNTPAYIGLDDMGNMLMMVIDDGRHPVMVACYLAQAALSNLSVHRVTVGEARQHRLGRVVQGPEQRQASFYVQVMMRERSGNLVIDADGNSDLLSQYEASTVSYDDTKADPERYEEGLLALDILEYAGVYIDVNNIRSWGDYADVCQQVAQHHMQSA